MRLGVNLDHVATLRNARGGNHPDLLRAAQLAKHSGADGITLHLREDRRHIKDADVFAIRQWNGLPLNLEMAATDEMLQIATNVKPNACCLVPEKREELTTEGGLNVLGQEAVLTDYIAELKGCGARISLFVDPGDAQIQAAKRCGADIVELHTGSWCDAPLDQQSRHFEALTQAAHTAHELGLEVHAGHGLNFETAAKIAQLSMIAELNIGHFMISEALFEGLETVIIRMRKAMA